MADSKNQAISEIAEIIWDSCHSFAFGETQEWPQDLFLAAWADARSPKLDWSSYKAGWYWLLVNMTLDELQSLTRPSTLPKNGRDMGSLTLENTETFGKQLLCCADEAGWLVIYNGHQTSVKDRVRRHFALGDDSTGALGLKHYGLSGKKWEVRIFAEPCMGSIAEDLRPRIRLLMNSSTGRRAVETAWRSAHRWPVLCKI